MRGRRQRRVFGCFRCCTDPESSFVTADAGPTPRHSASNRRSCAYISAASEATVSASSNQSGKRDCEEADFTITRRPHSSGTLWAGYMFEYRSGDVGLQIADLDPSGPAASAGMEKHHEGWIIVKVNEEQVWSPEDPYISTLAALDRTKSAESVQKPFTVTIRKVTTADKRQARELADLQQRMSEQFVRELLARIHGMKVGDVSGAEVLQTPQGLDLVLRQLPPAFGEKPARMAMLKRLLEEKSQAVSVCMNISGPRQDVEAAVAETQAMAATRLAVTVTVLEKHEAELSAEKRQALRRELEEAARQDTLVQGTDPTCVVCMDMTRKMVLLHGGTGHACVCCHCAVRCGNLGRCPVCQAPVDGRRKMSEVTAAEWGVSVFDS